VAVYRYDKRNLAHSKEMLLNPKYTVKEEYLLGLKLVLEELKKMTEIDSNQIIIMGHSQAGYLIPYFEKNLNNVHGYIALGAPFDPMPEALLNKDDPALHANYVASIKSNGPAQSNNTRLPQKMLLIYGGRDIQVPAQEMEKWRLAGSTDPQRNWTFSVFPKLNHLAIAGEGVASVANYNKAGNVPYEVILKMASFILY